MDICTLACAVPKLEKSPTTPVNLAHAPVLASSASRDAIDGASLQPQDIDAVVVSTCTGYLCPGLSGYVVERLGLRADVQAYDLVGQGCAAALPNMQLGRVLLAGGSCRHVLSVCVEVSSAAMFLDNDPGVLISACLFGDGAGAAVLSREPNPASRSIEWKDSGSLLVPAHRDALKFETRQGMLRNVLTREVPRLAATHALSVLATVLDRAGLQRTDIAAWIMHAGGRDVLQAVEERFGLATPVRELTVACWDTISGIADRILTSPASGDVPSRGSVA